MSGKLQTLFQDEANAIVAVPNKWPRHQECSYDIRDIQPINSVGMNSTINFKFQKNGKFLVSAELLSTFTSLDGNGTSATEKLVNGAGCLYLDEVDLQYAGTTIQRLNGTAMLLDHYMHDNHEKQLAKDILIGCDTDANRVTAFATGTVSFTTKLPFYFKDVRTALPIEILNAECDLIVKTRPMGSIMQFGTAGDGTYTGALTSLVLRLTYLNTDSIYTKSLRAMSDRTSLNYRMKDIQMMPQQPLASGSTNYQIKLSNFFGHIAAIWFVVRTTSDVNGGAVANDPDNYKIVKDWHIEASGEYQTGRVDLTDSYTRLALMPKFWSNNPVPATHSGVAAATKYVYAYSWCLQPESVDTMGGWDIDAVNNPTLVINFASSLGANSLVDIYALTNNVIQVSRGELKKVRSV